MGALLLVPEVAARLRCSASNVYALVAQGRLKHFRVGAGRGGIRVSEEHLAAYLTSREEGGGEPVRAPAPEQLLAGEFTVLDAERLRAAWKDRR
jgi:excisionase family DNA binding protein